MSRVRHAMRDVTFALAVWIVFAGCYLLFAGEVSGSELIAGFPIVGAATAYAAALHRARVRVLGLRAPWSRAIGRPIAALVPDAVRVGVVLLRVIARRPTGEVGAVARQRFRAGGANAADAGRRALVTLGLSLAPNGYALELASGGGDIPLHRLAAAPSDDDTEWPA